MDTEFRMKGKVPLFSLASFNVYTHQFESKRTSSYASVVRTRMDIALGPGSRANIKHVSMLDISCSFSVDKNDGSKVLNVIKSFFYFTVCNCRARKRCRELSARSL